MFADSLISRRSCLCALLLLPAVSGCGESAAALEAKARAEFDQDVDKNWRQKWDLVEGVQYLEKGGLYYDSGEPGEPAYDKSHVLPLMKRISAKHGLKWQAVLDKKNRSFALAMIGQFPDVDGIQKAVMDSLIEEQKSFPIDLLVQHGDRWLSLDFMSREDADFLAERPTKE